MRCSVPYRRSVSSSTWFALFLVAGAVVTTGGLPLADTLQAAGQAARKQAARKLVNEALHAEIYGDQAARQRWLAEAAALDPTSAAVMWHAGKVRFQNKWVDADDVPSRLAADLRWKAYQRQRATHPDTPAGQLALANWCGKRGLADQERAHLNRVLQSQPDHPEARRRLGFRRLNGQWVTDRQIEDARRQMAVEQQALNQWQPRLVELRRDLGHRSQLRRSRAAQRIKAIDSADAIPALETVLSRSGEQAALLVVESLGSITAPQAAASLVRHAVLSNWDTVRAAAAEQLKTRDRETYVPTLLSSMFTPVKSRTMVTRGAGGEIQYRHLFFREGQDARQLLVLDTQYTRVAAPRGNRNNSLARAANQLATTALQRELGVARQNRATTILNERICAALATATGVREAASPAKWWKWWSDENEVFVLGDKTLQTVYRTEQVPIVDQVAATAGGGSEGDSSQGSPPQTMDCLVAATLVWTNRGAVAVEQVMIGDSVLSQDPETGELAYKPVLQTTVRPAGRLVRVHIGKQAFETSGGHLFWVAGEGWVKSRDLKPGMEVHTPNGTRPVRWSETGTWAATYNLVVADAATYFVGPERLLSHDNTIRRTTLRVVPGLVDQ